MVPTVRLCSGRKDGQNELRKVSLSIATEKGKPGNPEEKGAACGLLLVSNEETEKNMVKSKPVPSARESG